MVVKNYYDVIMILCVMFVVDILVYFNWVIVKIWGNFILGVEEDYINIEKEGNILYNIWFY